MVEIVGNWFLGDYNGGKDGGEGECDVLRVGLGEREGLFEGCDRKFGELKCESEGSGIVVE